MSDLCEILTAQELIEAERVFQRHKWTVRAGRLDGVLFLKLGPVTFAAYRYTDERWRLSLCVMNRERFVWPKLA